MKKLYILFFLLLPITVLAQNRTLYNQYMLNQGIFNPGYMDINTRYSVTAHMRKQWMTTGETPLTFTANGHYLFTKNHGIGGMAQNDFVNGVNTFQFNGIYNYHVWLGDKLALGMGVMLGLESRSLSGNYIYFDPEESTLGTRSTIGFNAGFGISLQSQNFDFGISAPQLFGNRLANKNQIYSTDYDHYYAHIGYKIRFNDNFVVYPTAMVRAVEGAPINLSLDGNLLIGQFFWVGGGYRSDKSIIANVGVFLEKGLRIVYTYENAYFTGHSLLNNSHEITLNYARTIGDKPFSIRHYTTRRGGKFRKRSKIR